MRRYSQPPMIYSDNIPRVRYSWWQGSLWWRHRLERYVPREEQLGVNKLQVQYQSPLSPPQTKIAHITMATEETSSIKIHTIACTQPTTYANEIKVVLHPVVGTNIMLFSIISNRRTIKITLKSSTHFSRTCFYSTEITYTFFQDLISTLLFTLSVIPGVCPMKHLECVSCSASLEIDLYILRKANPQ